jgi:hypothetical protein
VWWEKVPDMPPARKIMRSWSIRWPRALTTVPAAQATTSRSVFSKSVSRPTGLPAKQGRIRDFIDVVLEARWPPPLPPSLRFSYDDWLTLLTVSNWPRIPSARRREVSFWH